MKEWGIVNFNGHSFSFARQKWLREWKRKKGMDIMVCELHLKKKLCEKL